MKYKFSPSKIGLLKECPRCFWLEHNKNLKRPDGIFPSLPSGMDNVLKEYFDSYIEKDVLPPELNKLENVKLFSDKMLLRKWRLNMIGIKYEEEKFILKGAIDNLLVKGKKFIILDYKTRGYPLKDDTHEHYIEQQALYSYIFRKNGYDTEDYSYLLFYYPEKVVESVVLFNKKLVKINTEISIAEKVLKKALDVLKGDLPASSNECNFCKYREQKMLSDY